MYRKGLLTAGFVSAALMAGPVLAADMPAPVEPAPPPAPVAPAPVFYDWSGFYAGLHAGYAWGDRDIVTSGFPTDPDPTSFSYDSDGWLLGGQVGFNAQVNQWVFGVEGDLAWSGVDGGFGVTTHPPLLRGWGAGETHDMKWLGTLRGRLGVAFDSFLLYGTGGLAFAKIDGTGLVTDDDGTLHAATDSNTHTGWTIGAGVEAGLTQNLSVKVEYLFVDLGSKNYHYAIPTGAGGPVTVNADHQHHVIRGGLNWRFGLY